MKTLCIIPAREGSKGVKDKNVAPCNGKPLIYWTIDCARKAGEIDRVIVSTDSTRYRDMLEQFGKDLFPFIRPDRLAKDKTPSSDVITHALKWMADHGEEFDIVVLLEPTSPLRTPEQVNEAINILKHGEARAIVSVVELPNYNPRLAIEVNRAGFIAPYGETGPQPDFPGHPQRQALHPVYFMDGSIYASYVDTYLKRKCFDHDQTAGYIVNRFYAPEVDEPVDLIDIEARMKARQEGKI